MEAQTQQILITTAVSLLASTITAITTWLLSRKKYMAEVKSKEITNMHSSLDFYEDLSDDARQRLHSLIDENKQLREENIRIREENAAIRVDNAAIRAENARVLKELEDIKLLVNRLIESTCVNMACQIRNRGFAPLVVDKSPTLREQEKTPKKAAKGEETNKQA